GPDRHRRPRVPADRRAVRRAAPAGVPRPRAGAVPRLVLHGRTVPGRRRQKPASHRRRPAHAPRTGQDGRHRAPRPYDGARLLRPRHAAQPARRRLRAGCGRLHQGGHPHHLRRDRRRRLPGLPGVRVMTVLEFFADHTYRMVLAGTVTIGFVAGALGSFAYLRKQSLISDVIAHAALPGTLVAFLAAVAVAGTGGRSMLVLIT